MASSEWCSAPGCPECNYATQGCVGAGVGGRGKGTEGEAEEKGRRANYGRAAALYEFTLQRRQLALGDEGFGRKR